MPLFQPSNITPSTFSGIGGGTIAVDNIARITWQVNGTEPMTVHYFYFYDENNNLVNNGDIAWIPQTPQYPKDEKGNPNYYTFDRNKSWKELFNLEDGKTYFMYIKQWYGDGKYLEQLVPSTIITRSQPSLVLTKDGSTGISVIDKLSQEFGANYFQAQGDTITWVRWRLYKAIGERYELLDDTGIVNTQILKYVANNLISGNTYLIECTVQTENGVEIFTEAEFDVRYVLNEIVGDFSVDCSHRGSTEFYWENIEVENSLSPINAEVVGDYTYKKRNNLYYLSLETNATTIEWDKVGYDAMQFNTPWTLLWKGTVNRAALSPSVIDAHELPEGNKFNIIIPQDANYSNDFYVHIIGSSRDIIKKGSASKGEINYSASYYIPRQEIGLTPLINTMSAHPMGTLFVGGIAGSFLLNSNLNLSYDLGKSYIANTSAFNPQGDMLAVGGWETTDDGRTVHSLYLAKIDAGTGAYVEKIPVKFLGGEIKKVAFTNTNLIVIIGDTAHVYKRTGDILYSDEIGEISVRTDKIAVGANYTYIGGALYELTETSITKIMDVTFASTRIDVFYIENTLFIANNGVIGNNIFIYDTTTGKAEFIGYGKTSTIADERKPRLCPLRANVKDSAELIWIENNKNTLGYAYTENSLDAYLDIGNNYKFSFTSYGFKDPEAEDYVYQYEFNNPLAISLLSNLENDFEIHTQNDNYQLYIEENRVDIRLQASKITQIKLGGIQKCQFIYVETGHADYSVGYIPANWNEDTLFMTRFNQKTLKAGEFIEGNPSIDLYRENNSTKRLEKLYSLSSDINSIRDFSWLANKRYRYYAYGKIGDVYTSIKEFTEEPICRTQYDYLLLETKQDEHQPNAYRVINYWRFGNNVSQGAISNNNTPSFLTNFTPYRLKQPIERFGKSGILQSLLSNARSGDYNDTADQMNDLYELSKSENTFFLKDTKGNLFMVAISGAITQTINTKSNKKEVTISIPWEEIGSCEGISIVQLPTDIGFSKQEKN